MNNYIIKYKEIKNSVIQANSSKEAIDLFLQDHKDAFVISANDAENIQFDEIEICTFDNREYFSMTIEELKKRGFDCEPIWSKESILFRNTTINKALNELTNLNVYGKVIKCK